MQNNMTPEEIASLLDMNIEAVNRALNAETIISQADLSELENIEFEDDYFSKAFYLDRVDRYSKTLNYSEWIIDTPKTQTILTGERD
jgi:predicted AAA+ superfamily ATPase